MPSKRHSVEHLIRVAGDRNLSLQETVALGLLVARKWDRASAAVTAQPPNYEDTLSYAEFTNAELQEFRATSSRMLAEFASLSSAVNNKAYWWYGVSQSLAAAFIYSLFIALILFIVKFSEADVLTILRAIAIEP